MGPLPISSPPYSRGSAASQVIRIFISSTFRDMHAERDQLSRIVFPELRSRCLKRGADFLGLDLRWGVTEEEAEREGALALCLKEIERCRPFFVCLLGDRFGWVPPPEEVPAPLFEAVRDTGALPLAIAESYHLDETVVPATYRLRRDRKLPNDVAEELPRFWESKGLPLAGDSITAREILRGVFDAGYPATRAFFYLRKPGPDQHPAFPSSFLPVFVEQDADRRRKLADLKERIRASAGQVSVWDYEAGYAGLRIDPALLPPGLSAGERETFQDGVILPDQWSHLSDPVRSAIEAHGTVALDGMEALGQRIVDELWPAIEAELERPIEVLNAHQRERAYHERFVIDRTRLFIGRASETRQVAAYVANAENRQPLVVTGPPGAGKSAFLAGCVRHCRELHPGTLAVPYFIGAAPGSAALPATLRSLCETLRRELALDEEIEADPLKLRVQFGSFLEKAGARRPVVVFLDALNQLDPENRSHEVDWIPYVLPPGTKLVVSTLAGDCLEQLRRRVSDDHVVDIPALPVDDRRLLVEQFLDVRRKKLTAAQLTRILDTEQRPDAGLPLYLLVALEELCLFGDHQALSQRIERLPESLPELFDQALARLEQDHGRSTTESVCAWLAVSRSGLLESEVLDLLGHGGAFPRIRWTRLYRALEPYLKPAEEDTGTEGRGAGLLDFYHDQLRIAAYGRYLRMDSADSHSTDSNKAAHQELAGYFRSIARDESQPKRWRTDRVRGLSELPYHLLKASRHEELEAVLTDFDFAEARAATGGTFDLAADCAAAASALSEGASRTTLSDFARFFQAQAHILEVHWQLVFQQAANQPDATAPARLALACAASTVAERAWMEWLDKPQEADHCLMTLSSPPLRVMSCSWTSSPPQVIVCFLDGSVRAWDPRTGQLVASLTGGATTLSAVVSPDGKRIACCSVDRRLTIRDLETGAEIRLLGGEGSRCVACAWSPDGTLLLAALEDGSLSVFDTSGAAPGREVIRGESAARACAWSAEGDRAATAVHELIRVSEVATGKLVAALRASGDVRCCVWSPQAPALGIITRSRNELCVWQSDHDLGATALARGDFEVCAWRPDGRQIAAGAVDGSVHVFSPFATREVRTMEAHAGGVRALALTPDGRRALSGGREGVLRVWDVDTGRCLGALPAHRGEIRAVALAADGRFAVSAGVDDDIHVWDVESGSHLRSLAGARSARALALSRDARTVIAGGDDRTIHVWEAATGRAVHQYKQHGGAVRAVAIDADGRWAVSAGENGRVGVLDLATGRGELLPGGAWQAAVALCSQRAHVLAWGDRGVRVFDGWTGSLVHDLGTHGLLLDSDAFPLRLAGAAITSDGRVALVSTADGRLSTFELAAGACIRRFHIPARALMGVSITADGSRAALSGESAGGESVVLLIDLQRGAVDVTLERQDASQHDVIAMSPAGDSVAVTNGAQIELWDIGARKMAGYLRGHGGRVRSVHFVDGRHLLSGGDDGVVRLWRVDTRVCLRVLAGARGSVVAVAADVSELAGLDAEGTLHVWDSSSGTVLRASEACGYGSDVFQAISVDGSGRRVVAGGLEGAALILAPDKPDRRWPLPAHASALRGLGLSDDGRSLVTAGDDGFLRLWELDDPAQDRAGDRCWRILDHGARVAAVALTGDGFLAVSGGDDGKLRLWDVDATRDRTARLDGHDAAVTALAWSPDGTRMATGAADGRVKIWETDTMGPRRHRAERAVWPDLDPLERRYRIPGDPSAASPDGRLVARARGAEIIVRRSDGSEMILTGHRYPVTALGWSQDGTRLATGSDDKTVRLWAAATGGCLAVMAGHGGLVTACTFSADGSRLVSASYDGTLRLWSLEEQSCLGIAAGHTAPVNACAWSPDGRWFASVAVDRTLRAWASEDCREIAIFPDLRGWHAVAVGEAGLIAVAQHDRATRHVLRLRGVR